MPSEPTNSVSEVTRRSIFDALSVENFEWSGRLSETRFLGRIFDLDSLPSSDPRHETASQDITRHREWNDDWSPDWVFYDRRFDLLRCPDELFLKFLCEMVHPVVQAEAIKVSWLIELINKYLVADGWLLVKRDEISGRPTFSAQRLKYMEPEAGQMTNPEEPQDSKQKEPALSKKTVSEFREFVATWTLREIRDLFDSEDIALDESYISPHSGQRRSLADSYLQSIDPSNHADIAKLLRAFEHVLVKLTADIEDNPGTSTAIEAERSLKNLVRWLQRDGYSFESGRLAIAGARTPEGPSPVTPKRETATKPAVTMTSLPGPTAFMSYSWEDDEHKTWVRDLAARLRGDGVDVTLDRWHAAPGDQLPRFMETSIRENNFILIVLTPTYKERSNGRKGGVGYEGDIMTGEVFVGKDPRKFIPILRKGSWDIASPSWLKGKYGIDLRDGPHFEENYGDLINTLHGMREEAPPLGKPPRRNSGVSVKGQIAFTPPPPPHRDDEPIRILNIIASEVGTPRNDGTRGSALYAVPFQLSHRPTAAWAEHFVRTWDRPPSWSTRHRPGICPHRRGPSHPRWNDRRGGRGRSPRHPQGRP